jgi:formylglycine-generating enzyme required for sulfatase activity
MKSVAAGTFTMGRRDDGDDLTYGEADELPRHSVTLSAYQISTGEVDSGHFADALNWAKRQGYLLTSTGTPWNGVGTIYAGGNPQKIVALTNTACHVIYYDGAFYTKTKYGMPGTTTPYGTGKHPAMRVTWYGAVAFCNWRSQIESLTPCYDMNTAGWPLVVGPPTVAGYRLATEAEWERAAAWDGSKHWIYGTKADTLSGSTRCNWYNSPNYVNPLGLVSIAYTSPRVWFNGTNVSPNGSVQTVDSPSPVGAYDMSGNAWEWCHDWYSSTYYSGGSMTNPTGPTSGTTRVRRGGGYASSKGVLRTAERRGDAPDTSVDSLAFRVVRSAV